MKKKKIAAIVTSVALIAAVGIGATLAYFTDQDTKQNVITMGKVDGSLVEDGDGDRQDDGSYQYPDVKPGDTLSKVPTVTLAADSEDAYVRMDIEITGLETLTALVGNVQKEYNDILKDSLTLGAGWTKGNDGYYYYNTKLTKAAPGNVTTPVFSTVEIPKTWGNEVSGKTINIKLTAELIQADNFDSELTIDNGNIVGWNVDKADIKKYENN